MEIDGNVRSLLLEHGGITEKVRAGAKIEVPR
jgi:hypothetical protein